jgi:hypothetical protein
MSRRTAVRLAIAALVLAIAAVILVIVAANTGDDDPFLPDAQQAVKQTPTPTPTPTTPSPTPTISEEEAAEAAAREVPQRYFDIQAEVRSDPDEIYERLAAYERVADGPSLDDSQAEDTIQAAGGFVQSGAAEVLEVKALEVDLVNDRRIDPPGPSVVVQVCVDVSAAAYKVAGEAWTPDDEIVSGQWDIRNYDYPDDDGWKVWEIEASDESCER